MSADFWDRVAVSRAAGSSWFCSCGTENPGWYDVCHGCRCRGNPDSPAEVVDALGVEFDAAIGRSQAGGV